MDTNPGTVTVWQSGRLAPRAAPRHRHLTGQQWLGAALLALSAVVLGLYIAVLQGQVGRSALEHEAQRSAAVAAPEATPDNSAYDTAYRQQDGVRATTVSLTTAAP